MSTSRNCYCKDIVPLSYHRCLFLVVQEQHHKQKLIKMFCTIGENRNTWNMSMKNSSLRRWRRGPNDALDQRSRDLELLRFMSMCLSPHILPAQHIGNLELLQLSPRLSNRLSLNPHLLSDQSTTNLKVSLLSLCLNLNEHRHSIETQQRDHHQIRHIISTCRYIRDY